MTDVARHREAAIARALEGDGRATREQRRAAFDNQGVAEPARVLIDKVANHAYQVTDDDVAAAKQALPEDEIFELVVCAALGQASRQLAAVRAIIAGAKR
jgi:hypothetical protein